MNVSWEPPLLPNGILEGYRLVYEPCMPVDGKGLGALLGGAGAELFAVGWWRRRRLGYRLARWAS